MIASQASEIYATSKNGWDSDIGSTLNTHSNQIYAAFNVHSTVLSSK